MLFDNVRQGKSGHTFMGRSVRNVPRQLDNVIITLLCGDASPHLHIGYLKLLSQRKLMRSLTTSLCFSENIEQTHTSISIIRPCLITILAQERRQKKHAEAVLDRAALCGIIIRQVHECPRFSGTSIRNSRREQFIRYGQDPEQLKLALWAIQHQGP
jgi:hypothetical protein